MKISLLHCLMPTLCIISYSSAIQFSHKEFKVGKGIGFISESYFFTSGFLNPAEIVSPTMVQLCFAFHLKNGFELQISPALNYFRRTFVSISDDPEWQIIHTLNTKREFDCALGSMGLYPKRIYYDRIGIGFGIATGISIQKSKWIKSGYPNAIFQQSKGSSIDASFSLKSFADFDIKLSELLKVFVEIRSGTGEFSGYKIYIGLSYLDS